MSLLFIRRTAWTLLGESVRTLLGAPRWKVPTYGPMPKKWNLFQVRRFRF